jgi:hypothetical protein
MYANLYTERGGNCSVRRCLCTERGGNCFVRRCLCTERGGNCSVRRCLCTEREEEIVLYVVVLYIYIIMSKLLNLLSVHRRTKY